MTEEQWLQSSDPQMMLTFLAQRASERKLRLFACACCRRIWNLLGDDRLGQAVESAERYADGREPKSVLAAARAGARRAATESRTNPGLHSAAAYAAWRTAWENIRSIAGSVAEGVVWAASYRLYGGTMGAEWENVRLQHAEVAALVREVFGNPFRPVAADPAWRTVNVLGLARVIYEERAFDRLPILADALLDAGCADEEVLAHCRQPGEHVRGCWVADLLLGKG